MSPKKWQLSINIWKFTFYVGTPFIYLVHCYHHHATSHDKHQHPWIVIVWPPLPVPLQFSVSKCPLFFSRSSILSKIFCMVSLGMLTVSLQQTEDSWMYCKNVNFLTWHIMLLRCDCSTLQYFINLLLSSCSSDCTMYCRLSSGLLWIDRLCRCLLLNTDLSRWLWGSYLGTTLLLNNSICGIHLWCERCWQQMSTSSSTLELSSAIKFNSLHYCFAVVCSVAHSTITVIQVITNTIHLQNFFGNGAIAIFVKDTFCRFIHNLLLHVNSKV